VQRVLTVRHLLTHTAGFATGGDDIRVASALLQAEAPEDATDLAGYAQRVARAPLATEPGTRFRYDGVNTEVLARVVEVASGQPFDVFLRTRIFRPLGMHDTGFDVPLAQRGRIMALTTRDAEGRRVLADTPSAREAGVRLRAYPSGAGGLYSTVAGYLRFGRMLAEGGKRGGVRLLAGTHRGVGRGAGDGRARGFGRGRPGSRGSGRQRGAWPGTRRRRRARRRCCRTR